MSDNKVAIYIRVSTQMQIDKDSLPMQRKDLTGYCELILNTTNYEIFEDAGYSGKNTDRPQFQLMLSKIRSGEFTHLLVWKIDRISRNLLDFASLYKELKDLGVTFISKNEQFDTSTAIGEAMLKIILVFAELERNMTSERVTATMISRANSGQWNGGRVPFGYDYDPIEHTFSINEQEEEIVLFMHNWYEENKSLIRLTKTVNDLGYRTRLGYLWSSTTINLILKSVFYCGDYLYNVNKDGCRQKPKNKSEWVTIKDHHPAIISRTQKERIVQILKSNQRLTKERGFSPYNIPHIHVFSGILICGKCGKSMNSTIASKRDGWVHSQYLCGTRRKSSSLCNQPSTSDVPIGDFAFNLLLNMLNAQKSFSKDTTTKDLEDKFLAGSDFSRIKGIDNNDLEYIHFLLSSKSISGEIYGKGFNIKPARKAKMQISKLKLRRNKVLRALDRLNNLFLYADDAMSEKDFILKREKLEEEIDEIDQQILASENESDNIEDDETFIKKSSEFIIAKNLSDRNYIYYKRLSQSVEQSVLKDFVNQIFDKIIIFEKDIQSVTFKNGISLHFIY